MFVSILMLTHNAPDYVEVSVETVRKMTEGVDYELVVVDNASDVATVTVLERLRDEGKINKLVLSETNLLFAAGNNEAARHASERATHYLLLNSDIEVTATDWLRHLADIHVSPGITTYGYVPSAPRRVDGYCLLVDAELYDQQTGLDEGHQWWWGVTKLQARALTQGATVKGYYSHDEKLIHFGGKSGDAFKSAKGMDVTREETVSWFKGHEPIVLDPENIVPPQRPSVFARAGRKAKRIVKRLAGQ